jgi:TM2 domain-containing membrane protein YozV
MQIGTSVPPPLLSGAIAPSTNSLPPPKRYAIGKNPTVAVLLTVLMVGFGQFYNGDIIKGVLMLVVGVIGGLLTFGVVWIGIVIWAFFDSYLVASGKVPLWY